MKSDVIKTFHNQEQYRDLILKTKSTTLSRDQGQDQDSLFQNQYQDFSSCPQCISTQYNLSVESNQNVESKWKSVESKMGKWGVQLLAYLQFYN